MCECSLVSISSCRTWWHTSCLLVPASVDNLAAVFLTLLEDCLRPLFWHINSVDVASRLDAEPCACASSWETLDRRHVDVCSGVELEGRLCAGNLEVNLAFRVVERRKLLHRLGAGVDWNVVCIGVHDEAVVDSRLFLAQREFGIGFDARIILNWTLGNEIFVYHQVLAGR
jgi:hypothetical protein